MFDHSRWQKELARLEGALRPIANRAVDISDPNWLTKLRNSNPLDEAGARTEAEPLLLEILTQYASTTDAEREAIRKLVAEHPSFAWAATPPEAETAKATVRLRLIHFSLLDQGGDPRDAVLWLEDLCRAPSVAIDDLRSIRSEVAQMSSDEDKYGFGSTRAMLLRGYGQYGKGSAPDEA